MGLVVDSAALERFGARHADVGLQVGLRQWLGFGRRWAGVRHGTARHRRGPVGCATGRCGKRSRASSWRGRGCSGARAWGGWRRAGTGSWRGWGGGSCSRSRARGGWRCTGARSGRRRSCWGSARADAGWVVRGYGSIKKRIARHGGKGHGQGAGGKNGSGKMGQFGRGKHGYLRNVSGGIIFHYTR